MKLIPGEKVLWKSKNLIVTTHRIRNEAATSYDIRIKSIMLEELDSCVMISTANNAYIVLGGLCLIIGLFISYALNHPMGIIGGTVAGLLCILGYFLSREQILILSSARTTIRKNVKGLSADEIKDLIDTIENAKNTRHVR